MLRRGAAFLFMAVAFAQPPEPHFEVASVRINRKMACMGRWDFRTSHGALTAENAPLLRILSRAYNLTDDRVSGPAWLDQACYDIRAKASPNASESEVMAMLRILLKERFHLAAQIESAERPALVLVIDKEGSKLLPYGDPKAVSPNVEEGKTLFMVRHMPDLCERLGKITGKPVIDRTGLTGDYMISFSYTPYVAPDGASSEDSADIYQVIRTQLGLRLEPQRVPVEILKVSSVDKIPAGN